MDTDKHVIKKATIEDAVIMSKIHADSWRAAYKGILPQKQLDELSDEHWVTFFQEWLERGCIESYIVFIEDVAVGCVTCGSIAPECADRNEIISLYILPDYFGKGIGKVLMHKALELIQKNGFEDAFLWTLKENKRARLFYEKNGFILDDTGHCERIFDQDAVKYVKYI
ncbi:GNAT family N-acetyltransferase [Clostridium aminobutyricum]|uniref:GNAT family N-acetyltransferase n=1 Tax=Clostridium aminobutyricum TaxID=33953 RepID=A0A939D6A0_CLOAM|nr:GNAT family N-acetyltransferase [Clostridium aminobutyricum]MBN7772204.1 GNAT family N-acetyltransferase [Clostridium aminobutyricum]